MLTTPTNALTLTSIGNLALSGAEISAYDPASQRLFVTSSAGLQVVNFSNPAAPALIATIDFTTLGFATTDVTSVAVKNGLVAVALPNADKALNGQVVFLNAADHTLLGSVDVGALPDMLTFTPDGKKVLVANEGEVVSDAHWGGKGSVSIIDLSGGVASATVQTAGFTGFDGQEAALRASGVRLWPGQSVSDDVEPEYIAVSPDGGKAMVTLQEANAVAVLDIASASFTGIVPLGAKDFSALLADYSDRDGPGNTALVNLQTGMPVKGLYMPDAIASYEVGGDTYFVIANEGDDRNDFLDPDESIRVGSGGYDLDSAAFPNEAALKANAQLGRLTVSNAPGLRGDTDGDGDIDQILMYGGRSFSILDANGNQVFDSADIIERIAATQVPTAVFDDRSDNKGPEPEGVTVGVVGGKTYAFVGLERAHQTLVFDITDPANVSYTGTAQRTGDLNPEGTLFIPATESPTGKALYVASNEASNNLSVFEVKETPDFTLQLLHFADAEAGLLAPDTAPNLAALVDAFDDDYANTLILAGGDNFLPGPFVAAGTDASVAATHNKGNNPGAADIEIHNRIGVEASTIGNHEFDLGTNAFSDAINDAAFPYLSANLDFSGDGALSGRYQETVGVGGLEDAAALAKKIVPSAVVNKGGEQIGLVGVTTQILETISSTGGVEVKGFTGDGSETNDMALLAAQLQPVIDDLRGQGVDKIVLMAHLQQIGFEQALAPRLSGVDIILAAGSNTRLGDSNDVAVAFPGHAANFVGTYPIMTAGSDGQPTLIVNTDNEYTYLGRLVVDFDAAGNIIVDNLDPAINGAYAATTANVAAAWNDLDGNLSDTAFAEGTKGEQVGDITEAVDAVISAKDGNIAGYTDVYLEGERNLVRNQETNLGNITADANLGALTDALGAAAPTAFVASLKNGGGIRAQIGSIDYLTGDKQPPLANPDAGKPAGAVSALDIENSLRFNNGLMAVDVSAADLKEILEHGVAVLGNQGRYPQIGGVRFSYDADAPAGARVADIALIDQHDGVVAVIADNGVLAPDAPAVITLVTLNFLANGGDGYPIKTLGENFRFLLNDGSLSAAVDPASDFVATAPANMLGEQQAMRGYMADRYATPQTAYDMADTPQSGDTRIQNTDFRADTVLALGGTYQGTDGADTLTGSLGDDSIDGGAGKDSVAFGGNKAAAAILQTGLGAWKVTTASGGTDTLTHVETLRFADGAVESSIDLSTYVRVGRYDLPEPTRTPAPAGSVLAQEVSAVTYNWDTDTLFVVGDGGTAVVQISKTGQLIDSMTLAAGTSPQGTEFYDPEGLTYIGGGKFVMTEERDRHAVEFTYNAGTTLNRTAAKTVALGTNVGNVGLEGLSYDPLTGGYIFVKEASPQGIFQTTIDFAAGTASNGSPTTVNSANLFDPALAGVADIADVYALSNIPALNGLSQANNLLVLSQESGKIVNIDRTGTISSSLTIQNDPGNPLSVADQQHEGLTMDRSGKLYVVSENGGGDFDHPQLWVYAPAQVPNAAPTGLALLNQTSAVLENASTSTRLKVADIALTDDGLGTNNFTLSGPDAGVFEVNGFALYLKAGTVLDYEAKATYAVSVNVDDPAVGTTPDATANFALSVTDVVNENPARPTLFVSEVAPWSSGNGSIAADWFEVTNTGATPVDLTGWKMDDGSNTYAAAVALTGVSSIAPGESVIFIETNDLPAAKGAFLNTWFGGSAPAGLQIGGYSGGGVGLGTGGDAVNLFDAAGVPQAGVTFGASTTSAPFLTFNNAAGLNNAAVATLSAVGVNGAFAAPNSTTTEIGSPGTVGRLFISEVAPWSSGNSPVGADWFEVTNTTAFPVDLTGWKMDDASGSPAAAVALNGVASIAPGESVIFIESANPAAAKAAFLNTWFGGNAPASLQIGSYTGSGVGLGAGGDAVHLYDANNLLRASVSFGASPTGPFATFDNAAGLNNAAITSLSVVGTHAAFAAVNDGTEIGSPGEIAPVNDAPVAVDDSLSAVVAGSGNRAISFASLLANDLAGPANEGGQSLTIVAVGNAAGGTVSLSGTEVIFTPTPGFTGTARFDYTARDNGTTRGADDFLTDVGTASFIITPASTGGDTGGGTTPTPAPNPEDQVPSLNGGTPGDGNGDGIADSQQASVASLTVDPSIRQTGSKSFVTLSDNQGLPLTQVHALPAPTDAPAGVNFPLGRFGFQVGGVTPGGTAKLSLFVDGGVPVNGYWKLNPQTQQWENIATKIEAAGSKTRIDFAIQDGGPFDADGAANGSIQDPGGPGFQANRAPTVAHELADQSANKGQALSFQVPADAFADPDNGDVLSYAAALADGAALPAWLAFDPATRQFGGTPGNGDVGSLSVTVTATDGGGASVSDSFALAVANVNDAPTGGVTVSGTATQGQTLSAAHSLADADGLGPITYHWLRAGTDTGATGATYVLTKADVGKAISVQASYTDALGNAESVTSTATVPVANVNDAPTGGVTISGAATQGQTLTAAHSLADVDGLGPITYHWLRDGADTGATGAAYVLTQADVGQAISVKARYTDALGSAESVASATTGAVADSNDAPTLAHAIAAQSAQENRGFRFTVPADSFADVDAGDSLGYGAGLADGGALPGWLAFDAATRTFSGTPGFTDAGSLQLRLTATDRGGASVNGDFSLTVADTALPAGARFVAAGGNRLDGKNKADALVGLNGDDKLNGKGGNDQLYGGAGQDELKGGAGNDSLDGGAGDDLLYGQDGRDVLIGGAGDDLLNGGAGVDVYRYLAKALGLDDLVAGDRDTLAATKGDKIAFDAAVWAGFTKDGVALDDLSKGAKLAGSIDADSNIALVGRTLQIDLNGDGQFGAGQDFAIEIMGQAKVSVDAGGDFLVFG